MLESILFEKRVGCIGAELQNLLKLFEWVVDGGSFTIPKKPTREDRAKIIY